MLTSIATSKPPSSTTRDPTPQIQIQIRLPTPTEYQTHSFIHRTTNLINTAYSAPATTLLKPNKPRTNTTQVQTWLESGTFYLAFACDPASSSPSSSFSGDDDDHHDSSSSQSHPSDERKSRPIGTIRLTPLSPTILEIGILTVDPEFRASGLGRMLIAFAEGVAVKNGVERMRIEVPSPQASSSVGTGVDRQAAGRKRYLRHWYEGLGYEFVGRRTLEETVPGLVEAFEGEVEILVMEKVLGA
jgi:GNAT superfamily N-acetyltransferase